MCRKLVFLMVGALVLGLVNEARAIDWTDNAVSDHLWSTAGNWNPAGPPASDDEVFIYYNPDVDAGPVIDSTVTAVCARLKTGFVVGSGDGTVITMTGGSLHIGDWFGHAEDEGSRATMNVSGGIIIMDRGMGVGQRGHGVLNVTGGLIQIVSEEYKDGLWVPGMATSSGHLQLDGGRIETTQLIMNQNHPEDPCGFIDVTRGVLVINGGPDKENDFGWSVQDYLNKGYISAFGGAREVVLEYDFASDKTTVKAFLPEMASNPSPADLTENVCPGMTLSWTPGIFVDDHNVYFGTSMSDVNGSTAPLLERYGPNSFKPSLELGKTYYWRVDEVNDACDASPWVGAIWEFTTNDGNAFDLSPANGLRGVTPDLILDWTPGCLAASHIVYLGTDFNDVKNGVGDANKGAQSPGYDPDLEQFTTYFWRVEEVNGTNTWPGEVLSFRTGYGGTLMYYMFDGTEGFDLPSPITDDTGNVSFTKYTGSGWVKYGESNPIVNSGSGTSGNFDPNAGLYRADACGPGGWDLLRLDGYQYTIEMWLKPEVLSPAHGDITLIGKRGSWNIQINDPNPGNNNTAYSWVHAGNTEEMFDDSAVEGEWAHLAAVYDQTDESEQRMRFYLNGVLQESAGETSLNPADDTNMVTIGMEELAGGGFTGFFDGLIDELRVVDMALTPCDFLVVPGPEWASCPSPGDGEEDVDPCEASLALTWRPGIYVDKHDIYFGTSLDDVGAGADPCKENHDTNSWTPPALEFGTTYYWRVDEVNGLSEWPGVIWQFATRYEIVDPNLLLWYKFDETSGDSVFDSSGHGLHGDGAGIGDEDWEPNDGHINGCLSFSGDERVDVPRSVLTAIDKEITISVWLNGGASTGDRWVFSTGYTYFTEAAVPYGSGEVYWRAGNDSNDALIWEEASPKGWRGNWHHFAFVKDENSGTMTIYFDGLEVDSKTGTTDTLAYTRNRDFEIGEKDKDGDNYLGKMDDFRIYDYAKSADEISALYRCADLALAWGPSPYDGQIGVPYDAVCSWKPGDYVADPNAHEVYFGTNWDDVNDANNSLPVGTSVYKGAQSLASTSYNPPGLLDLGQTYYWRIDEVNDANNDRWKGKVWKFTTANFITIDNFDDDTAQDPPGNDWYQIASATISLRSTPPVIGKHSMRYAYDNWFDMGPGYYSEIQTINLEPNDWTIFDQKLKLLSLWFYGQSGNAATITEQMYVFLKDNDGNDYKVKYGDDAQYEDITDVQIEGWQEWLIPLNRFSTNDVNLANLDNLCIGFGIRGWWAPAGLGVVYFDDIRLYPAICDPLRMAPPEADLNNDCEVDFEDVEIMADEWLEVDVNLSPVQPPSEANLIGWWKLDDATGSIVTDYAGYDNNGVIETIDVNAWWVSGHDGNALEFDGGRVRVPDAQNLRPLHQVSACAWIYYSEEQDAARVVVKGADNKECYEIEVSDDDTLVFHVRDGNDPNADSYEKYAAESDDDTLDRDEWIHVAGTYDGNSVRCYINGELMDKNDDPNNQIPFLSQDTNDLAIGSMPDDDRAPFEGTIDDVRVYNYALSEDEVAYIATDETGIFSVQSVANLYNEEDLGDRAVNLRDFAKLANNWLKKRLWPE